MNEETLKAFRETADAFIATLEGYDDNNFNAKPFVQSWSGAQVAQHIYLSVKGLPTLFAMKPDERKRDHTKNIGMLRSTFLNFDSKMEAPKFIIPEDIQYEKTKLISLLRQSFDAIANAINDSDLTEVVPGVEFPGVGALSRYEWAWFSVFHTQRHTRQAEEIYKLVGEE
jgi:hypothetical protein